MARTGKGYIRRDGGISFTARVERRADQLFEPVPTWCDQCAVTHPSQHWHLYDGVDPTTPEGSAEIETINTADIDDLWRRARGDVSRREGRRRRNQRAKSSSTP